MSVISNTTVISNFASIGQLDVLRQLFGVLGDFRKRISQSGWSFWPSSALSRQDIAELCRSRSTLKMTQNPSPYRMFISGKRLIDLDRSLS